MNPDNVTEITNMWSREYSYIRKVNIFFEKIKNSNLPKATLDEMKGQMYFLRAWFYFSLSRLFGGVPIITKPFSLNDKSFDVKRNTYEEVGQFVIKECNKASQLLDGFDAKTGQISKAAAVALKARMLLYMASPLHNPSNDKSKWVAAKKATEAVFKFGFTLHPTYKDLFKKPIKKDEIILARNYTVNNRIAPFGLNYNFWPSGFDARQELMPTQHFVNMFQMTNGKYPYLKDDSTVNPASGYDPQHPFKNRDPRFYVSILYPGAGPVHIIDGTKSTHRLYEFWEPYHPNKTGLNPNKVDPENGQPLFDFGRDSKDYWLIGIAPFYYKVNTGYTFRKLVDFTSARASTSSDFKTITVFFRLAEFYLNYAEIQIHLGHDDIARKYINKVRSRPAVHMPPVTASGKKLVYIYRRERAVELNLENQRFFDLMRWKAAPGHVDLSSTNGLPRGLTKVLMDWTTAKKGDLMGTLHYTYGELHSIQKRASWQGDYYYLFPIPQQEIKRSHGKLKQNPGY